MEQVLNYFRQAEKVLDANQFPTDEDYELFMQNVFSEVEGMEYRLACSHDGSTILEKILKGATPFQLRVFFEKVRGKWSDMCCHRYASHVAEAWVRSAADKVAVDQEVADELPKLDAQMADIAGMATEESVKLVEDAYGTHVVRLLLQIWGGELDGRPVSIPNGPQFLATFATDLFSMPKEIFNLQRAVSTQQSSPVLQLLVRFVHRDDAKLFQKLLGELFPGVFSNSSSEEPCCTSFLKMTDNEIGSRFVEALVGTLDSAAFLVFFSKLVRRNAGRLLDGFHSNFVFQCIISRCHSSHQFGMILECLKPHATDLVIKKRHGVLLRLSQWVVNHELAHAEDVMSIIFDAFHLKDAQDRKKSFIAIARLQPKDNIDESKNLIAGGCSLLQLLPMFPATIAKPVIDGFLDASVASIVAMSMHPNGSHVVEAIMSSRTVSDTVKQRTIRKLRDHVDTLAADKFGSHIVDKCWNLATTELREKIVERLMGVKTRLEDNPYGRMVLRNCRAYEFERDAQNWKNAEESAERKKAMFADILEDSTNDLLPDSLRVDVSDKKIKRKQKDSHSELLPQELKMKKKKLRK
ncbi:hypothetical protein PSACC_02552 [Paramicrosporidium saccamoebae]|uniref:Nucleolar protein 9 n=1 Tax=Paramicrosporidium saccamoebae TaxID=1246581 RepID=A0A2H9TIN8_9FUNG|nr:hypothetical protein PSACC_02552 [Paramicrosporidium saccamoebae]